jgi:hypothetical protein
VPAAAMAVSPAFTSEHAQWRLGTVARLPCARAPPGSTRVSVPSLPSGAARMPQYDTPALLRGALALDVLNCRVQF